MEERESEGNLPQQTLTDAIVGQIRPIHLSKSEAAIKALKIAEMVRDGHAKPLDTVTRLSYIIEVCEAAKKLLLDECVDEVVKEGGKTTVNGAEIIKKEVGVKYNYENCGDVTWERYDAAEHSAKEGKKEREKFLKNLTKPMTIVEEESGEIHTVSPPVKSSTTSIAITLPNQ